MLQRAASNAYSWWWASHIRTKQSKWLEQNLQDMEEKVQYVLKLIEEDGDSFARRAEMYYKKRPELISFVEESYRAYRALAERYDHISTELQNANNTIASVFPEQVQFAMEDDDDDSAPQAPKKALGAAIPKANIPKVPKAPKELKRIFPSTSAPKRLPSKKSIKVAAAAAHPVAKSGLSKSEGLREIDRLQKQTLALQTEKEFVKSSYESVLSKYWEIENEIIEMQEKVCSLQDEFGAGAVIEDSEARTLMASVALKSCKETLAQLQQKQEKSAEEATVEHQRITNAREKFNSLKETFLHGKIDQENPEANREFVAVEVVKNVDQEPSTDSQEKQDLELLRKKIREHLDAESDASLSVTELAEQIDELVNKVISLEASVSSQTTLIRRMRMETDDLQAQIGTLEDDKATLINGKNDLVEKLREMEKRLFELQELNRSFEDHNKNLQSQFTEAHENVDHLTEKLQNVMPDEEVQATARPKSLMEGKESSSEVNSKSDNKEKISTMKQQDQIEVSDSLQKEKARNEEKAEEKMKEHDLGTSITGNSENSQDTNGAVEKQEKKTKEEHEPSTTITGNSEKSQDTNDAVEKQEQKTKEEHEAGTSITGNSEKSQDTSDAVEKQEQKTKEERESGTSITGNSEKSQDTNGAVEKQEQKTNEPGTSITGNSEKSQDTNVAVEQQEQKTKEEREPGTSITGNSEKPQDTNGAVEKQEQKTKEEVGPDWKSMFMNGMESREKFLLNEYTTVLRNFKDVKKKLAEVESKNGDGLFNITVQLRELKCANLKKDEQIRVLKQKLSLLQTGLAEDNESEKSLLTESSIIETDEDKLNLTEEPEISETERKFRMGIDELLEENLDFWLRFSSTFHQIQKFETEIKDLQSELLKLEEKQNKNDSSSSAKYSLKSDAKPLYKHLQEIHTELSVWIEKSVQLKEEVKCRFSSLCGIQEEITTALKESAEDDDFKFTSYQAAKFQGEILNMKQENNKVADELQAGLDHVTTLQLEAEKTLAKLNEEFEISGAKHQENVQLEHSGSRSRVPLRSFIFGSKTKKQKQSIFSCVHPVLQRKYNGLKAGMNM